MRVILQNRDTKAFVSRDSWVSGQSEAQTFSSGVDAYDYCVGNKLRDMDIVLTFHSPDYNCRVPVRDRVSH